MAESSDISLAKSGNSVKGLIRFTKRDRQISPSPEDQGENTAVNDGAKRNNVEEKRAEREDRRLKKEEAKRIKDIEQQGKTLKRSFRRLVKNDLAKTSCETFITFCIIFAVGTFFFGGGTALIQSGRDNDVFDFIVVGSSGIVIGIIFTTAGMVLVFKPVYLNYKGRKREYAEKAEAQVQVLSNMPQYIDDVQRTIMTSQLGDEGRRSRPPSNAELYGDTPRSGDPVAHSCDNTVVDPRIKKDPPPLAMPNVADEKNNHNKSQQHPVVYQSPKEDPLEVHAEIDSAALFDHLPELHPIMSPEVGPTSGLDSATDSPTLSPEKGDDNIGDKSVEKTPKLAKDVVLDINIEEHQTHGGDSTGEPVLEEESRPESESTTIVVTHHVDTSRENGSPKHHDKSTPTTIGNELLSREHSANARSSKIQTPSSVILNCSDHTFESEL